MQHNIDPAKHRAPRYQPITGSYIRQGGKLNHSHSPVRIRDPLLLLLNHNSDVLVYNLKSILLKLLLVYNNITLNITHKT